MDKIFKMSLTFTESQLKYLSQFEGETQIKMEKTLRIGIVASQYHKGDVIKFEPTIQDWEDWLGGLPERAAVIFRKYGFEKGILAFPFRRFYMELKDLGLEEYMKKHLSIEELAIWKNT